MTGTRYTDSAHEQQKNPHAYGWIDAVCCGDPNAKRFCLAVWSFTHLYDDLVDRDRPVTARQAAAELSTLLQEVALNPFFVAHAPQLLALMQSALFRWGHADELESGGDALQAARAAVVRCGDVDLYLYVAYLLGGSDHMNACRGLRSFDPPDEET